MKKRFMTMLLALTASIGMASAQQLDSMVMRIKGMKCDECGHKVMVRLNERIPDGIEDMWFDYEKRIATVLYDPAKTCPDSIKAPLIGTRYNPTAYSKNDIITRGMGLRMAELKSSADGAKAMAALKGKLGIDSLAPHVNKNYLFIRYDANKTCKAEIRKQLVEAGFTPTNYYSSDKVQYAYYKIPGIKDTEATREKLFLIDGVEDFNINEKKQVLAITYFNDEMTADRLDAIIKKTKF